MKQQGEEEEENNTASLPPSPDTWSSPGGKPLDLGRSYGCCLSRLLVPAGFQRSVLRCSRKRGTIRSPLPKKHPTPLIFVPAIVTRQEAASRGKIRNACVEWATSWTLEVCVFLSAESMFAAWPKTGSVETQWKQYVFPPLQCKFMC